MKMMMLTSLDKGHTLYMMQIPSNWNTEKQSDFSHITLSQRILYCKFTQTARSDGTHTVRSSGTLIGPQMFFIMVNSALRTFFVNADCFTVVEAETTELTSRII